MSTEKPDLRMWINAIREIVTVGTKPANLTGQSVSPPKWRMTPSTGKNIEWHLRELESALSALHAFYEGQLAEKDKEIERLTNETRREKCDKCGRMIHYSQIGIEVKDGAPIDDRAGFMWCHGCHCQRIVDELKSRAEQAEARLTEHAAEIARLKAALTEAASQLTYASYYTWAEAARSAALKEADSGGSR